MVSYCICKSLLKAQSTAQMAPQKSSNSFGILCLIRLCQSFLSLYMLATYILCYIFYYILWFLICTFMGFLGESMHVSLHPYVVFFFFFTFSLALFLISVHLFYPILVCLGVIIVMILVVVVVIVTVNTIIIVFLLVHTCFICYILVQKRDRVQFCVSVSMEDLSRVGRGRKSNINILQEIKSINKNRNPTSKQRVLPIVQDIIFQSLWVPRESCT